MIYIIRSAERGGRAVRPAGIGLRRLYAIGAYTFALLNHYYGLGF